MNECSPIIPCRGIFSENELYIKRDDLLPFSFGGNKVRIAEEFFADMVAKNKNCMVGYGNSRSNLCRVLANMSYARLGPDKCHIISPSDDDGERVETNNSRLVNAYHAIVHTCLKKDVAATVDAVLRQCTEEGADPYYIYGDKTGKGNEAVPVRAYAKAYEEIMGSFDYIFHASGTGMTQAGLLAGKRLNHGVEHIVGISVARPANQAIEAIQQYLSAFYSSLNIALPDDDEIIVEDAYLCGGYGKHTPEIADTIRMMMSNYGVALDTTYTGKAFYGMLEYLRKNNIHGKRILFIHTGGTPLFFDSISPIFAKPFYYRQLSDFICEIDSQLPTPLSKRVNLEQYTQKLYKKAHICVEIQEGRILSLVAGYIDDLKSNLSYITLVATLPNAQRKGLAARLLRQFIKECQAKNISGVHLHTEPTNLPAIRLYKSMGFIDYIDPDEPRPNDHHLICWLPQNKE